MPAVDASLDRRLQELWQRCRDAPESRAAFEELLKRLLPDFGWVVWRAGARWRFCGRRDIDDLLQEIEIEREPGWKEEAKRLLDEIRPRGGEGRSSQ